MTSTSESQIMGLEKLLALEDEREELRSRLPRLRQNLRRVGSNAKREKWSGLIATTVGEIESIDDQLLNSWQST